MASVTGSVEYHPENHLPEKNDSDVKMSALNKGHCPVHPDVRIASYNCFGCRSKSMECGRCKAMFEEQRKADTEAGEADEDRRATPPSSAPYPSALLAWVESVKLPAISQTDVLNELCGKLGATEVSDLHGLSSERVNQLVQLVPPLKEKALRKALEFEGHVELAISTPPPAIDAEKDTPDVAAASTAVRTAAVNAAATTDAEAIAMGGKGKAAAAAAAAAENDDGTSPQVEGTSQKLFPSPPASGRRASLISEQDAALVESLLSSPSMALNEEESQTVLLTCIKYGMKRSEAAHGKESVVFIGNTGSGKSTLCNFLHGCTLKSEKSAEGIKIVSVSDDSPIPELMEIGHTNTSATFLPDVKPSTIKLPGGAEAAYVDCPGFLDNRGASVNIANAVNIKTTLFAAESARFVVVLNYHSLKANRAQGLRELARILIDLFGDVRAVVENTGSVLLVVTQVPIFDEDGDKVELNDIQARVRDGSGLSDGMAQVLGELASTMALYHPLGKGNSSWLGREAFVEKITLLKPISNPDGIFQTVLTSTDERELRRIVDALGVSATAALESKEYDKCAQVLRSLTRLEVIGHVAVTRLLGLAVQGANRILREREREANDAIMREDFSGAEASIVELETAATALVDAEGNVLLGVDDLGAIVERQKAHCSMRKEQHRRWLVMEKDMKAIQDEREAIKKELALLQEQRASYQAEIKRAKEERLAAEAAARAEKNELEASYAAEASKLEEKLLSASIEEKSKLESALTSLQEELSAKLQNQEAAAAKEKAVMEALVKRYEEQLEAKEKKEQEAKEKLRVENEKAALEEKKAAEARKAAQEEQAALEEKKKADAALKTFTSMASTASPPLVTLPAFDDLATPNSFDWLPLLKCSGTQPAPRCSHVCCDIDNVHFVVIGGGACVDPEGSTWHHFGDIWLFNSLRVSWEQLDSHVAEANKGTDETTTEMSLPPRRGHAAAYCSRRKLIVVFGGTRGGVDGDGLLNDTWTFSLETKTWSRAPIDPTRPMPKARRGHSGWLDQEAFYIIGGYVEAGDSYPFDPDCWGLDLDTWEWKRKKFGRSKIKLAATEPRDLTANWPGPEFALTMPARVGRHLYFFGGCSPSNPSVTNWMYRLNLDTFSWLVSQPTETTPLPRFCHGLVSIGKHLILCGGTTTGGRYLDDRFVFDTVDASWSAVSLASEAALTTTEGPETGSATQTDGGVGVGDSGSSVGPSDDDAHASSPSPRNGFSMIRLGNKVVMFGGGVFPNLYFNETWAFDLNLPLGAPPPSPPPPFDPSAGGAFSETEPDLTLVPAGDVGLEEAREEEGWGVRRGVRVHRRVLAARCPYFASMFKGLGSPSPPPPSPDSSETASSSSSSSPSSPLPPPPPPSLPAGALSFAESSKSVIELPDVAESTLRFVLNYLYSGTCDLSICLPPNPGGEESGGCCEREEEEEEEGSATELSVGSLVQLRGLKARADLNGARGVVTGPAESSGRFLVALHGAVGATHTAAAAAAAAAGGGGGGGESAVTAGRSAEGDTRGGGGGGAGPLSLKATNLQVLSGRGDLAADGYVAVQRALVLCAVWALDHLRGLVEDAVVVDLPGFAVPLDCAPPMLLLADECQAPKLRMYALYALKRGWPRVQDQQEFQTLPETLQQEVRWWVRSLL